MSAQVRGQQLVAAPARSLRAVLSDYVSLTKPRVMSLLLLTELLAMVTAARGWPGWGLTVFALVGGALASGGASAINCWFDRDIDAVMGRTRNRPLPAGRIGAGRAVVFGIGLTVAAFLDFALLVNPLAAVLSLAGGAFYVFVYTFWLKRSTKENIVIGGAAGVAPVGLALFALVFLWTPPHFWALSIIIRRDYQAVSVPMRPVVVGVRRTKTGILAYTLVMVAASCALAIWLGPFELLVALVLGIPFVVLAGKVLMEERGMRWARRLFQFSMIYLFAFFLGTALVASLAR